MNVKNMVAIKLEQVLYAGTSRLFLELEQVRDAGLPESLSCPTCERSLRWIIGKLWVGEALENDWMFADEFLQSALTHRQKPLEVQMAHRKKYSRASLEIRGERTRIRNL